MVVLKCVCCGAEDTTDVCVRCGSRMLPYKEEDVDERTGDSEHVPFIGGTDNVYREDVGGNNGDGRE